MEMFFFVLDFMSWNLSQDMFIFDTGFQLLIPT